MKIGLIILSLGVLALFTLGFVSSQSVCAQYEIMIDGNCVADTSPYPAPNPYPAPDPYPAPEPRPTLIPATGGTDESLAEKAPSHSKINGRMVTKQKWYYWIWLYSVRGQ